MEMRARVMLVAAARPNFMKVAPLFHALAGSGAFEPILVHTGQHYDRNMSGAFLADLGLPDPHHHLGVGSGSHARQTAGVMVAFESLLADTGLPDWLIVVGDVNSTAACAMVAAKLPLPCVHLEAGLRSHDRSMPEEHNRRVTDVLCDVLWTPSPDADANLLAENVPADRISRVGNIMLDSFEMVRPRIESANTAAELGLEPGGYGIVTLHRPGNVDDPAMLGTICAALAEAARTLPLAFPVHPRTAAALDREGHRARLEQAGVRLVEPLSYIPFMSLVRDSRIVITDSGGLQEETTYLGIPCLTLRPNTERPITLSEGTNRLVDAAGLGMAIATALSGDRTPRRPEYWDGQTAARCVADLVRRSAAGAARSAHAPGRA